MATWLERVTAPTQLQRASKGVGELSHIWNAADRRSAAKLRAIKTAAMPGVQLLRKVQRHNCSRPEDERAALPAHSKECPPRQESNDVATLCQAFASASLQEAKDIAASLILAEAVYKIHDMPSEQAIKEVELASAQLPFQLQQPLRLQWSLPHVIHRYLIAEGPSTLYLCFMGTKTLQDLITNTAVIQELMWKEHRYSAEGEPAAHTGFLHRARSIPCTNLLQIAEGKGKKLVLCGHSLGGAVAELCALDLLHAAQGGSMPDIRVISFAAPAIGNEALAALIQRQGWQHYLHNYLLPEDTIGGVFGFAASTQGNACKTAVALPAVSQTATQTALHDPMPEREKAASHPLAHLRTKPDSFTTPAATIHPRNQKAGQARPGLQSNIVAFSRPLQVWQRQGSTAEADNREFERGGGKQLTLVAWIARFAYRSITFPLWARRSFVPASSQLFLNPQGLEAWPRQPEALALARASMSLAPSARALVRNRAGSNPYTTRLRKQQLIAWMHRMPAYRARFMEIARSAAPPQSSGRRKAAAAQRVVLSGDVAPRLHLTRVTALQALPPSRPGNPLAACPWLNDDDWMSDEMLSSWPKPWQLVYASLATSDTHSLPATLSAILQHAVARLERLAGIWRKLLQLVKRGLEFAVPPTAVLLLSVQGHGLEHCTEASLLLPEGQSLRAEVIATPESLRACCLGCHRLPGGRARALDDFFARLWTPQGRGRPSTSSTGAAGMLLVVQLRTPPPQELEAAWSAGNASSKIQLRYRSDFSEDYLPVEFLADLDSCQPDPQAYYTNASVALCGSAPR